MALNRMKEKRNRKARRAKRVRKAIQQETAMHPRLSVFRSIEHIYVQIIDDAQGKTIVSSSDKQVKTDGKKRLEVAALVGADVAARAKKAGITSVIFDRGPNRYLGRVKALAEAARKGGLKF